MYVPGTAPLQGEGQLIIEQLPLLHLSHAKSKASVAVEGQDQDTALFVLSAVACTPEDLLGIHQWQTDEALQINLEASFLASVGLADREVLQTLLQRVVAQDAFAFKARGRSISLEHDDAGFDSEANRPLVIARQMAAMGVFTCLSAGAESSEWQLTRAGLESLSLSFKLHDPKPVIVAPAADTVTIRSASEMATVQILLFLQNQGWEFSVRCKGDKPRCPAPYRFSTEDSPKVCWLHHTQKSLCHEYLVALATAAEHLKEVPYFQTKAFYASLLFGGEEGHQSSRKSSKRKRAGRNAEGFAFQEMYNASMPDQVQSAQAAPKRKAAAARGGKQRGRGRKSQSRGPEAADPPAEVQDTEEADDDPVVNFEDVSISSDSFGDMQVDESAESGRGSERASGSSSGSGSGSSSSDSSSSSESDRAAAVADALPAAPEAPVPAPAPRAPGGSHSRVLADTTFFWKGSRFTIVKANGIDVGLSTQCNCQAHKNEKPKTCTRSLRFGRHEGPETTERRLKWWLLQAAAYPNRSDHVNLCPYKPSAEPLPTLAELDARSMPG